MATQNEEAAWAYQNAFDLAVDISDQAVDLSNAVNEEETPDDLLERVEKIEKSLEDLRGDLDEMPRY